MLGQKRVSDRFAVISYVLLMVLILDACQPQTIIVEKGLTQVVRETVKETVIVEGTPRVVVVGGMPSPTPSVVPTAGYEEAVSSKQRILSPQIPTSDQTELAEGNSAFAFDLYQALCGGEDNLLYSPYSISLALAMTYAGARGGTARQMADTMHLTLPPERFHPAFNALDQKLASRSGASFQLSVANGLWGQTGYHFLPEYLDTLALYYGAGVQILDIRQDPKAAVNIVNEWTSYKTAGRIPKLLGSISTDTKLLLTNAIYFNARWMHTFQERAHQRGELLPAGLQQAERADDESTAWLPLRGRGRLPGNRVALLGFETAYGDRAPRHWPVPGD